MTCKKCGKEYEGEVKFCSECGNNLQEESYHGEKNTLVNSGEKVAEFVERKSKKKFNTRKKLICLILVIFVLIILVSTFSCKHEFLDATCENAAICSLCGKEKGDALGHSWDEADCQNPRLCSRCGEKSGKSLGHSWEEATCANPKKCKHCNETVGKPLGHSVNDWSVAKEATCSEKGVKKGTCEICNNAVEESIPLIEHSYGDWEIVETATVNTKGKKAKTCEICGYVSESEYEISQAEYKAACKEYSYGEIARNPNSYKGKLGAFYGKVVQVMESDIVGYTSYTLRVAIYGDYNKVFLVSYFAEKNEDHILEDDYITMYGEIQGTKSYETVMGNTITIPYLDADIIVIE